MKNKLFGFALLGVASASFVLASCQAEPPAAKEGVIYQTDVESFWVGVGHAYMSFEYVEEAAEGELSGYVFKVNVDAGDGYSAWLSGTYALEEENGVYGDLTLTGNWDASSESPTTLDGTTPGVAKTYALEDGVYTIGVGIPSAGVIDFELDPVADKVGEDKEPSDSDSGSSSSEESTSTDSDTTPDKTVQVCLVGESRAAMGGMEVKAEGKLDVYTDATWEFAVKTTPGMSEDYLIAASGTWAVDMTTYVTTLTVVEETAPDSMPDALTLNVDYADPSNLVYTCEFDFVSAGMTFEFSLSNRASEPEKTVQLSLSASTEDGKAGKIDLYTDSTWALGISYYPGMDYVETASGTYAMDGYAGMTLTVVADQANVLSEDAYAVSFDAVSSPGNIVYTCAMTVNVPQVGELNFNFTATMAIPA